MHSQKRLLNLLICLFSYLMAINLVAPLTQLAFAQNEESELFLIAQKAYDDGFYDVSIRYADEFIAKFPQSQKLPEARLLIAQCYYFKGQYLKTFDILKSLLPYPTIKDAVLFWLGENYFKGTDYTQAQEHYRQVIENYPNSTLVPQATYSLAWTNFEQQKYKDAKDSFLTFINKFPNHELIEDSLFKIGESDYNLLSYELAAQDFKDYVSKFPKSNRHDQAFFYIGESYYYLGNFSEAVTFYAKVVETSKNKKLLLASKTSLGWSYLKLNDLGNSKKFFDEAQTAAKENNLPVDDILLGLANLYATSSEHSKAIEIFDQLIKDFPESTRITDAYLGKANVLYLSKDYAAAIKQNNLIIEKYSSDPKRKDVTEKALLGLAWTYLKMGDVDLAIKNFQDVVNRTDNKVMKVSALAQIGDTYQDNGKFSEALEIYEKILKDFPESFYTDYIQYRQGINLLKMDRIEAATLVFQSLENNFPKSKYANEAKYYVSLAYFKKSDWSAAKEELTMLISASDKAHEFQPDARYLLGLSLFNLNQTKEAMKIFQDIIKDYPDAGSLTKDSEMNIAKCFFSLGDDKEALKRFKIIIYKYPGTETTLEALLWLSDYYLNNADYNNVILYDQQLIDQFPGSNKVSAARFGLGQAYQSQGLLDQALNQYKLITDHSNRELYAKAQLAIADIFSKSNNSNQAIEAYQKIIESCPEFKRDAYVKMAEIYQNNRSFSEAIDTYTKALKADKGLSSLGDAKLQFLIADTFEASNKPSEAIQAYLRIPYLYPKEAGWVTKSYLRMARIFEDREDWEDAKLVYGKIIQQGSDEAKFAKERLEWIKDNISVSEK